MGNREANPQVVVGDLLGKQVLIRVQRLVDLEEMAALEHTQWYTTLFVPHPCTAIEEARQQKLFSATLLANKTSAYKVGHARPANYTPDKAKC